MTTEDAPSAAQGFLEGLLAAMGTSATVTIGQDSIEDGSVQVSVTGENLGVLVGRRGVTLGAVQDLTRAAVRARCGDGGPRVDVDIEGYRARRVEALAAFARQLAEDVRATEVPKALEPMSAPDRKVVHDALADVAGIGTESRGEEPHRYVVISVTTPAEPAEDG